MIGRVFLSGCCLILAGGWTRADEEPLHRRIDGLIEARFSGEPVPLADDAEFLRRVHLDFAGRIPSAARVREFLADRTPDKRSREIDTLLDSPEHAERMTDLFHVMLMEQRGDHPDWQAFLSGCFRRNAPWDEIVRTILEPARENESLRGAAFFHTQRLTKVGQNPTDFPGLTRDVGRLFLGIDLQCAECHDHLFIDDYKQKEFQGLFAALKNLSIRNEKFPAINEASLTEPVEFVSVFTAEKGRTGPRIPFGEEFGIPDPPMEDPGVKKKRPDPNDPPSFSALGLIAAKLPSAENRLFRENIANRLWFQMMGQGLVEPLDQFHEANPPSHPELLELLGTEFALKKFDIKWFLRELALTRTWQRSSRLPPGSAIPARSSYLAANQRPLTVRQILLSTLQATGDLERLIVAPEGTPSEEGKKLQAKFAAAFAPEAKEPLLGYVPSVKQALFLSNDGDLLALLAPRPGNLLDRLSSSADDAVADELSLSIYSRLPEQEEREFIATVLRDRSADRQKSLRDLVWAMLSSMEFQVNH